MSENQIVAYRPNDTVCLAVRLENDTVWLEQAQLCDLFGVVKSNISYHLKNIFATKELDYGATVQKIRTVRLQGVFYDGQLWDARALVLTLKDLGKKCFAFTKLDAGDIPRIKKLAFEVSAR